MAILIETRPDVTEREQIWHMKEQLEAYLNSYEAASIEDIDRLIANAKPSGGGGSGGGAGVTSYLELTDKPTIEGVILRGNRNIEDFRVYALTNSEIEELLNNNDITIGNEEE